MRPLLLIVLLGYVGLASGQVVKCDGVWRNANDCAKGKVQGEVVQVYTPLPAVQPPMTKEQRDAAAAQKSVEDWDAMQKRNLKAFQETMRRFGPTVPVAAPPGTSVTPGKTGIVAPPK